MLIPSDGLAAQLLLYTCRLAVVNGQDRTSTTVCLFLLDGKHIDIAGSARVNRVHRTDRMRMYDHRGVPREARAREGFVGYPAALPRLLRRRSLSGVPRAARDGARVLERCHQVLGLAQ